MCRAWKKDERLKTIPFVFYTATYTDERDREFALSLGAERFIVKPEEPETFLAIIRETIQQVENSHALRAKPAGDAPEGDEVVYLKQYNEALIRKLEAKMEQLEQTNRQLEQDIAARRTAEASLRESEERYRSLVEMAPDAIVIHADEQLLYINRKGAEALGAKNPEELIGLPLERLIHPECRSAAKERIGRLLAGIPDEYPVEDCYLRLDGTAIPVETAAAPITYQGRKAIQVIARDITERKRAEEERTRLEIHLRQVQKMEALGALAGGIAHDFNNILAIIMGYTDMAKLRSGEGSPIAGKLNEVLKATERAKQLVKQILAFSRRSEQQKTAVQLGAIVKEAMQILRPSLPSTIEIKTEDSSEACVLADPIQMHQMLMNLCANAAYAMRDSGGILEVTLADIEIGTGPGASREGLRPGRYVSLTVKDNGHGIDPSIIDSIFDPFFTTKELGEGTGLGLSVVHGIVRSHGGSINVVSFPGKGATFTVLIPAMESADVNIKAEPSISLPRGRERVLVVDDEPSLAEMVEQMLAKLGYDAVSCTSGIEALEIFRHQPAEKPFDLVITDMTMPRFTGMDLARELSRLEPPVPIIIVTGFSQKIDAHKARELGFQGFLMKPVTLERLATMVRTVLDRKLPSK